MILSKKNIHMKTLLLGSTMLVLWLNVVAQDKKDILYVGTYSVRGSKGIYVYDFHRNDGSVDSIQSVRTLESPTFLAIHPSGKFLYSVNRGASSELANSGSVSAYSIDEKSGKLTLLNHKASYGKGPCHISVDQTGTLAFVSHYVEGTLVVFKLNSDGSLRSLSDSVRFTGHGLDQTRQEKPHIHSATVSPDNRFLLVTDLGTDRIYSFWINYTDGKLLPAKKRFTSVSPGSGPRHFTFHPSKPYAYVVEELTSTIARFSYIPETGALEVIEDRISALPKGFTEKNASADIHIDPTGKFLLLSNRGHNSLAIFSISKNGKLKVKGFENTVGNTPRNFLIDNEGNYILVANQDTDNVVGFKLDADTGMLKNTANDFSVPSPVCLKILSRQ
jgi:6-phosphogluconolactonase